MVDYSRLTKKLAQELSMDYTEGTPSEGSNGFSEDFTQGLDLYADLVDQGLDYLNIVYVLKDQLGDEAATQVLEFVTKNDMLARLKNAQENIVTWFAISDGEMKYPKIISEEIYNQYWSDFFEAGFDVVGKLFASPEEGEPSIEDPRWEEVADPAKEDKWVLI